MPITFGGSPKFAECAIRFAATAEHAVLIVLPRLEADAGYNGRVKLSAPRTTVLSSGHA